MTFTTTFTHTHDKVSSVVNATLYFYRVVVQGMVLGIMNRVEIRSINSLFHVFCENKKKGWSQSQFPGIDHIFALKFLKIGIFSKNKN